MAVLRLSVKNCPRCGEDYNEFPALSRTDNKTEVCPPCGTAEAMEDFLGSGAMPQEEWAVKNVAISREFARDVREMRSVEILEIVTCSHESWAWLDCAECRDKGETCDQKVCADCGASVS